MNLVFSLRMGMGWVFLAFIHTCFRCWAIALIYYLYYIMLVIPSRCRIFYLYRRLPICIGDYPFLFEDYPCLWRLPAIYAFFPFWVIIDSGICDHLITFYARHLPYLLLYIWECLYALHIKVRIDCIYGWYAWACDTPLSVGRWFILMALDYQMDHFCDCAGPQEDE